MTLIGIDASRAAKAKRTGTETYSLELIKQFARLASPTTRLRLYTPHAPQHNDWPDSPHVETRIIPWPRLWTHLRLAAELHQAPPDLLFVPAHVLPLFCPVPAVVTVHDLGYRFYPSAHKRFSRWYLDWTTRRHSRVASHVIADSEATKSDLIQIYQADSKRITVAHLGRDETLTRIDDRAEVETVKNRYKIEGDYLLYIGTLQPRKNLLRLLDAFSSVTRALENRQIKLVLAGGQGWLYNEIFSRTQQLRLTEQVIFTGYIAEADKATLLSDAVAYLFPSLYEGFGLPVLEAMSCGTPVLTSCTSSLPEVAGDAALLVDPHNTQSIAVGLMALLTNPMLRERLSEHGFQQIQKFSWSTTAKQIWQVFMTIVIRNS
ncbi:glycosyltransferase family 1 protein [Anaerolineales bacterium HSG25]|nr:glycosyltransferase family 1 protein [Anaerolineales bacterium HSG25]